MKILIKILRVNVPKPFTLLPENLYKNFKYKMHA